MMIPFPGIIIYRTFVTLQKLISVNVKSVPYNLFGGAHGHLGLLTFTAMYACINPNALSTRPDYPGPPVQVLNSTQFDIEKSVLPQKEIIGQFNPRSNPP